MSPICPHDTGDFEQFNYTNNFNRYGRQVRQDRPNHGSYCGECDRWVIEFKSAREFIDWRAQRFADWTGQDPTLTRDMFYRPFDVGDLVVYPAMSGRSAQITSGIVEVINPNRVKDPFTVAELDVFVARNRVGEPFSLKLQPTGASSRWKQHYGRWDSKAGKFDKTARPVTLWANAGSAVVIDLA